MTEFKTTIKPTDISLFDIDEFILNNLPPDNKVYYDHAVIKSHFYVHWNADIEMREWGIKSIIHYINYIVGLIDININDENDEYVHFIEVKFCKDEMKNWTIKSEMEMSNGALCPNTIDIDFRNKIIMIG